MSDISRDDVVAVFGPLDDAIAAEIISTGATAADLAAAKDWLAKAHESAEHPLPEGAILSVVEIIDRANRPDRSVLGESGSTLQ